MDKKCSLCGGELEGGKWSGGAYLNVIGDDENGIFKQGVKTKPFICKKCGHVEIFTEE